MDIQYQLAPQMVVFSHGFGVRGDARGMFIDIVKALPKGWGYVLFDYDQYIEADNQLLAIGSDERVACLQAVRDWAQQQTDVQTVHMIGHSIGALSIAVLAPDLPGAVILLAPPLSLGSRLAARYTNRLAAHHDGHTWYFPRSDGTTTVIDDEQLAEIMSIDAEGQLAKLALFRPYTVVLAGADEVSPDADYTALITMPSVTVLGIDQAGHDFEGRSREELVTLTVELLQNQYPKYL